MADSSLLHGFGHSVGLMTDAERYLLLDTMCKLALAGKSDDEVISFGNMMAAFIGRNESVIDIGFIEACEAAKRRAGMS